MGTRLVLAEFRICTVYTGEVSFEVNIVLCVTDCPAGESGTVRHRSAPKRRKNNRLR
jgi:hypothetical protein